MIAIFVVLTFVLFVISYCSFSSIHSNHMLNYMLWILSCKDMRKNCYLWPVLFLFEMRFWKHKERKKEGKGVGWGGGRSSATLVHWKHTRVVTKGKKIERLVSIIFLCLLLKHVNFVYVSSICFPLFICDAKFGFIVLKKSIYGRSLTQ